MDFSTPKRIDESVIQSAKNDIVNVIGRYIKLTKQGKDYVACCPFHQEKSPSFSVSPDKSIFFCFGCGAKGDAIGFVRDYEGLSFPAAVERITGHLPEPSKAIDTTGKKDPKKSEWLAQRNPIPDAPKPVFKHWRLGEPSTVWPYLEADGTVIGYVARFDIKKDDGSIGKETLPMCWAINNITGEMNWRWLSFATLRPLFGLDQLAAKPNAPVLVVEGEKTAQAARTLFPSFAVVSWPGGGKAAMLADWSPLKGRNITLWPDWDWKQYTEHDEKANSGNKAGQLMPVCDQPGVRAMQRIFQSLQDHGTAGIRIVPPMPGSPDGWDLADEAPTPDFKATAYAKNNVRDALEWFTEINTAPEPIGEKKPPKADPAAEYQDIKPYRVLGYDRNHYYFYQYERRQIRAMSKADMTTNGLLELAATEWWVIAHPSKTGFDKSAAVDRLIREAYEAGIYDPSRTRGRGAWMDNGRVVFHFGDKLWVDGELHPLGGIKSRYVYEMDKPLMAGPMDGTASILSDDDGRKLVELAKMFRWTKPASAALVAGFCALAPICGALRWRPHIWITGGAGCGKTTVLNEYIHRLMAGMDVFAQGNSTEAGIRQTLLSDALPVLMDESEQNNDREQSRVQNVISLIRQASSESAAMTLKGTTTGHGMHFLVRSMFCLSSIQVGLKHQADVERLTILALRPKREDIDSPETWNNLKAALHAMERDDTLPQRLFWRSITLLPITLRNINVFVDAAAKKFNSVREGDQYGTLLAGCWSMMSSELVTMEQATAMIDAYDWDEYREANDMDESTKALIALMEQRLRIPMGGEASVYEVIQCAKYGPRNGVSLSIIEAENILQRYGMRVIGNDLLLSNGSSQLVDLFKNTPYHTDWRNLLLRVNGVRRHTSAVRINGSPGKCVAIPLSLFDFPADPDHIPF